MNTEASPSFPLAYNYNCPPPILTRRLRIAQVKHNSLPPILLLDKSDEHFFSLVLVLFPYNKFTMIVSLSESSRSSPLFPLLFPLPSPHSCSYLLKFADF
jgi:hypothetical protein